MFAVTGDSITPEIPTLETPFGNFTTYFEGGGQSTYNIIPRETLRVSDGASLHRFDRAGWVAELLTGHVKPEMPPNMRISGCLAAIWRVRAIEETLACRFACYWSVPTDESEGYPDTGEGLDALTWRLGESSLSLGTEDGEFLSARGERHDFVPSRLSGELSISTIEYSASGLIVPFSGLGSSEVLQVQFVVAWECGSTVDSAASWFAVEQRPHHLLRQLVGGSTVAA